MHFPGYINIDFRKTGACDYVCDVTALPFPDASVEIIETYHLIEHLPRSNFEKAIQNWWNKLIPGGMLVIECPDFDRQVKQYLEGDDKIINHIFGLQRYSGDTHHFGYNFQRIRELLEAKGYYGIKSTNPTDYHRLEEPCIRVEAYKSVDALKSQKELIRDYRSKKNKKEKVNSPAWRVKRIHAPLIKKIQIDFRAEKGAIITGQCPEVSDALPGNRDWSTVNVAIIENSNRKNEVRNNRNIAGARYFPAATHNLPCKDKSLDGAYVVELLEFIGPDNLERFFCELERVLKPTAKLFLNVPHKEHYQDSWQNWFFTKASLAKLIDRFGFFIERMTLGEVEVNGHNHDIITVILARAATPVAKKRKRICCIGGYDNYGYSQLGFHWDGQARAFKQLGYDTMLLDIRKDGNYENLKSKILNYQPDLIWLGLVECLSFVKWMENDIRALRKSGCKVVYWFCDPREPENLDLENILDFVFISNQGQVEDYKAAYCVDQVYYMPQACSPQFMHRVELQEKYDIGFTGALNGYSHKARTDVLKNLKKKYSVAVKNNVRNNISDFYSKCRIVFGMNSDFNKFLYTSNRLFVALGCGAFYLCQWFPGIQKLAKNHEHLVWFKTHDELFNLVDFYLEDETKRNRIRKQAERLAHSKHTYVMRIQNMMDIIDGKTPKFNGFL
jgi:predicted SAM-dependent methyltransferase